MLSIDNSGVNDAVYRLFSCDSLFLTCVGNCLGGQNAEIYDEKHFLPKFVLYVSPVYGYNFRIDLRV